MKEREDAVLIMVVFQGMRNLSDDLVNGGGDRATCTLLHVGREVYHQMQGAHEPNIRALRG